MGSSVRSIAIAHHLTLFIDSKRLAVCSSQGAEVSRIAIRKKKGVERVVARAMPADDLAGIVDCISGFESIGFVRST